MKFIAIAVGSLATVAFASVQDDAARKHRTTTQKPKPTPASCTVTMTATTSLRIADGCKTECDNSSPCYLDLGYEVPCGCATQASVVTVVESACPTVTECAQCATGYWIPSEPTNCPKPRA